MVSRPGRDAAFFMPLRRAGTTKHAVLLYDPGSAAHHAAKSGALRSVPGMHSYFSDTFFGSLPLPATRT
jgi:hypothetical protein